MRSKVQDIEDRVKRAERWMIGLTAAIALSALCGVVVGFLQWHTLRGQLGEMKSSGKDTRELVEAAKTSADAAKSAANTAVATLEAARKSFVLEQRPYLILEGAFGALNKTADDPGGRYGPLARADVAPGERPFSTAVNETPLSSAELIDLQTGALTLYLTGIVRYTDGFDGVYQTEFCYFYFGADPRTWHICDSHNTIR